MTETQGTVFRAVYENRSFSRAANSLYVSQPAISKHLAKLEEELGVPLFIRTGTGAEPTEAARLLYEFLQEAGRQYRRVTEQMLEVTAGVRSTIRLGCPEIWNPGFVSRRVAGFAQADSVSIEAFRLSELLERLQAGRLDLVLSHDFYTPAVSGLRSVPVTKTGCGLLYSLEHFGNPKSPDIFNGCPFAVYDSNMEKRFTAVIEQVCAGLGFSLPRIRSCPQLSTALFETAQGKSVMLFSDWDSAIGSRGYGYYRLKRRLPVHLYYFPEKLSEGSRALVRHIAHTADEGRER